MCIRDRVNIDHHVSNTKFAEINHVLPEASSAIEVVYDLLEEDKIHLDAAEALYMGIICDSGVFKYSSTSEHTMQIGGHLMAIGVDSSRWIDEVFYERTYIPVSYTHLVSDLSPVMGLSLKLLHTCETGITLEQAQDYKEAHPDCEVWYDNHTI